MLQKNDFMRCIWLEAQISNQIQYKILVKQDKLNNLNNIKNVKYAKVRRYLGTLGSCHVLTPVCVCRK